ncbi:MAG TPA: endolytic transglycosylase MltG, partial [Thermoleophilaceae bacterium]|nr:endolytic transglycosylase MltG [Thermoleophilaceae bacterium]
PRDPARPRRPGGGPDGPDRSRTFRRRRIAAAAGGAVVLIGLWLLVSLFQPLKGAGQGEVPVTIPEGSSISQIGDLLETEGVVSSSFFFELRARLSGAAADLKSGEFVLAQDMSYGSALSALSQAPAPPDVISVTIPEGISRSEIAALVKDAGLGRGYEEATVESKLLDPAEYGAERAESLEGFLFPSSYELEDDASVQDLVKKQLKAFKSEFKGVDLAEAEEAGLTPYEVLIIASMVEREAQVPDERAVIAGVIYNRLEQDIALGIDATTRFALKNWTEPLTDSDFEASGAYNTRANLGLPPGPIGNPGTESIEAAAHPEDTDFLYYVFKPGTCGEHVFTKTLEEHEAAAAEYENARLAEGGQPDDC